MIYELQYISSKVKEQINLIKFNKDLNKKYKSEIDLIGSNISFDKERKEFILKFLNRKEEKEFDKLIKHPLTDYYINVTLKFSKINGQVYRRKSEILFGF